MHASRRKGQHEDACSARGDIKVVTSGARIGAEGPPSGRRRSWSVSFIIYARAAPT